MKIMYFAIYDEKANAFMQPFPNQTKGSAIRAFGDTVGDENTSFNKHPDDYSLVFVGHFDDSTGCFESGQPEVLAKAKDFVKQGE